MLFTSYTFDSRHIASVGYNGLKTLDNLGAVVTGVLVKDRKTPSKGDSFINYKVRIAHNGV